MMMLTHTDLLLLKTFEERLEYLRVGGVPGELTFGAARVINQRFYQSREWKKIREFVISRDLGFDLGLPGYEIFGRVLVHHMNPVTPNDLYTNSANAIDPEFLISVSDPTHRSIHFGSKPTKEFFAIRKPGDTVLW